ncbi:peptide chain release factor N(5)-glutamine methyltransferase [Cucumibacter marinus]|uniref:peptide chain release factor N(5)-glutamine methyltransferase n=1 Tax=Cucumibacter marinus TaxID=1121252 RepID=UPI0004189192|nr:peptide chain release factor N(5)-glutamine methyltransferase [Cucumibacter marinus]
MSEEAHISFGQLARRLRQRFEASGIDTAPLDARLLVAHAAGLGDAGLIVREHEAVSPDVIADAEGLADRRLDGEPVARIIGEKEFYGLVIGLNDDTLVPRPDTEVLVETGLGQIAGHDHPRVLDLGTGSGCVAIAIAMHHPNAEVVATDISAGALAMANANLALYGLEGRVGVVCGQWFAPLPAETRFDLIVSNPPYIESGAIPGLAPEVSRHDPLLALDGGADGLDAYREIIGAADRFLNPGGMLALEIGATQAGAVGALMKDKGFADILVAKDLAGLDRVVSARLP